MGLHLMSSRAIRFNGITDGIVVPTGQFRESGVDLLGPAYDATSPSPTATTRKSDATKIGRLHYPNQANALNAIFSEFTIDAYVVPDKGGVVVEKPGCFILKVGEPFSTGEIVFGVETIDGFFTAQTAYNVGVSVPSGVQETITASDDSSLFAPSDLLLGEQPLMLITAQYTGRELKVFVNGDLVAEVNMGEEKLLKNTSSDLFIGGRGGEFRGLIESVRINRGVTDPLIQPLTLKDSSVGFWDFNDDIQIPEIYFFNNAFEASPTQSKDGAGQHDGKLDIPFVLIGYDFDKGGPSGLGSFKIYDAPTNNGTSTGVNDDFTGIELLGSYITGLSPYEVRQRYVESSQVFVIGDSQGYTQTSMGYRSATTISKSILNAVINQSATHPITGTMQTPATNLEILYESTLDIEGHASSLDPITNPIERIRIVSLDFGNNKVMCSSVFLQSEHTSASNRWDPTDRGMLYEHADGTPVWLTLGNGDLVIDEGTTSFHRTVAAANAEPRLLDVTSDGINLASGDTLGRPKDAYTRATFTQSQRFEDKSGGRNTAYFMATRSRKPSNFEDIVNDTGNASDVSIHPDPPTINNNGVLMPPIVELDAGSLSISNGATATVFTDSNPNNATTANYAHNFYPKGNWIMEENGAYFNGHKCLKATTPSFFMLGNAAGNSNALVASDTALGWSIFAYIRPVWRTGGNATTIFSADNATGTIGSSYILETGSGTYGIDGPTAGAATRSPATPTLQTVLVEITVDPANGNVFIYHRGVLVHHYAGGFNAAGLNLSGYITLFGADTVASFTAANPPNTTLSGSANGSLAEFRVAEVLIYGFGGLNSIGRAEVNGYFLNKYGHL
tara:strand:- start:9130 stop:11667 length:2538 start_codon:yes stop_codon:yes gene_type:complete